MKSRVSKSKFKPHALKYFRQVQETGEELIITDHAKPVLKIVPFTEDPLEEIKQLRNSVIKLTDPTEPVAQEDWEALK